MPTIIDKYLDPIGLDETVVNIRQIAEGLESDMQNLPYARPDGIYPDMTVGAVIGADETAQWSQRTTEGSGAATVRSVQGVAVVWNQLVNTTSGSGTVLDGAVSYVKSATDGSYVFNGTVGEGTGRSIIIATGIPITTGHKYLLEKHNDTLRYYMNVNGSYNHITNVASIFTAAANSANTQIILVVPNEVYTFDNYKVVPQLFDLTQMFGSGNEPATVEEFEAMYPEAYYPYSAPTLKPVQIAGIASTDAQGGELDAIEWTAHTLRAAGSVADVLYADHVETRVGVVDLGTLTWFRNEITTGSGVYAFENNTLPAAFPASTTNLKTAPYPCVGNVSTALLNNDKAITPWNTTTMMNVGIRDDAYATAADFKAAMNGVLLFYELANPTTTPISPALPMTYKVQRGGTESIVVPEGEVSAAPVLTVAEPVNAGDEFARIWEAIQSLGYTRNAAQLSRPVSLTDIGSIDEVQKDTTDVVEIDTTKEVQE